MNTSLRMREWLRESHYGKNSIPRQCHKQIAVDITTRRIDTSTMFAIVWPYLHLVKYALSIN